ncbi:MAG TPA: hypothetical protein VFN21_02280, partial [Acidimicrobiales bacterium]|nr:hypothetical protein [Acidimicrobiales bacterium]
MKSIRRRCAYIVSGLVLAAVGLVAAPDAGAETETVNGEFAMLTYNVAGLPEVLSGSNPSVNQALISPLLNAYDLVLTQEDFANPDPPLEDVRVYHDELISQVDFPYLSTPQVPPMGTDPQHPDAILGDGLNFLSRMPLGTVDRVTWDDCMGIFDHASDCLATKGFAVTTIELVSGVTVDVYDLHADAGGAPEDQAARAANFAQLAAYIDTHSDGHAVIVGGDMNLHTDRPVDGDVWQTFLAATRLTDVCEAVDCGADADVIDKIAFRSSAEVALTPQSHTFERERFTRDDGVPLSDHDPLHVRFSYAAQVTVEPTTTIEPTPTVEPQPTSAPTSTAPAQPTIPPTTTGSEPTVAPTTTGPEPTATPTTVGPSSTAETTESVAPT